MLNLVLNWCSLRSPNFLWNSHDVVKSCKNVIVKSRENWREEEFYLILIDSFSPFRIDGLLVNSKRFPFKSWQIVFPSSTHSMWNFNWWPSTQREKPIEKTVHKTHKHQISAVFEITMDRCVLVKTHHFLSNVKVAFCKWWHFGVVHTVTTMLENN